MRSDLVMEIVETALLGVAYAQPPSLALLVLCIGLLGLAAWDIRFEEVDGRATTVLFVLVCWALLRDGVTPGQWLTATLAAVVSFGAYLWLGMKGAMGGGDVKLAPVVGFALGAVSPLWGIWWVPLAIVAHQLMLRAMREHRMAHVPAMSLAACAASSGFTLLAG